MVLIHDGEFRDGVATAEMRVVSGTGDLAGEPGARKVPRRPAGSVVLDLDSV